MRKRILVALIGAAVAGSVLAQAPSITPGELECLPKEANAAFQAMVSPEVGGSSVRLYFRRLNPLGAFYYHEMIPAGDGDYWTVYPKPEDREQPELTDEWWDILKDRDWMAGHDRGWLEDWLEEQDNEAAEYYVAVYSPKGEVLSRSPMELVEVREEDDCDVRLTPHEQGLSHNLTVGETTAVQAGKPVFHWLCDGIVTRIGWEGILRADEYCRACVVGAAIVPPIVLAGGVIAAGVILQDPPEPASPVAP